MNFVAKLMVSSCLTVSALTSLSFVQATEVTAVVKTENKAQQELRSILTHYQGFTADFAQVVKDVDGNLVHEAKGDLAFKPPGKFIWQVADLDDPESISESLISNGKILWWYNPFLEQVSLYDAQDAVQTTPFALLVSDQDSVWQQFTIDKFDNGYAISPVDIDNAQVLQLKVSFKGKTLTQIIIMDRTRQQSVYSLSEQSFTNLAKSKFEFVIPDDIEIDDQRKITPVTDGNVQY